MVRRKKNPPLPAINRRESMAVNHVKKFVEEELVFEPRAFMRLGALGRVYSDWCAVNDVINRRVSPNELLLRLEKDYGLSTGVVYFAIRDGGAGQLYALRGARLRTPELNRRRNVETRIAVASRWMPIIDGSIPDIAERFAGDDDDTTDFDEEEA